MPVPSNAPAQSVASTNEPWYIPVQRIIAESNVELLNAEAEELEGDCITLPHDENEDTPTFSFVVDRNGAEAVRMMECPLDIEQALYLVRRVRDGRMNMVTSL